MTTNEIETMDVGRLELLPPVQAPAAAARAMLREHAQMMNDAYQLAKGIVGDGRNGTGLMVPQRFRGKPEEAAAAMIYGAELGLNPLQAVQRVVPIHGMPTLESRTMVGLLKSRGFGFRVFEQSDQVVEIWGWEPTSPKVYGTDPDDAVNFGKRINPDATSRWTIERAIRAGYVPQPSSPDSKRRPDFESDWVTVSKTWNGEKKVSVVGNMKYITDPQTMLKAKGQAEVSRELAPDVLMGISYTREEIESEDQRQFDRADERGAVLVKVKPVTVDEIFAEEVPLSSDGIVSDNPPTAAEVRAHAPQDAPEPAAPETPAGDVTQDQGDGAPEPEPSPAEQPEPAATANVGEKDAAEQVKAPAKKAPAKKAAPRNVSKLRAPLEKRLFALLKDAGISGEADRDGRIAVYRAITQQPDVNSTDDLDDVNVGKVCDQLYRWQTANELDDQIAGILMDAAREAEETSAAPAAEPTSEGTDD